ncbi:FadR/GntR family transcriptional regulator [Corallococcus sp. AS-1-6]|uniref:FadR/GntR family transcriptional regulator n=1 Tax=Corallococcus sp. AS-1-6 TaxID=2874599 RepID=UPI001CBD3C10|nr:GntR family transcriptional regulator [Corallococcus sp. AS-1-6]MBZ4371705.1 GntR family transcriptional regulator [Corallococcus sp. AS-1-6]
MGMERRGLVAYVEAQIERDIALGRLHPSGQFGSEAKLARRYEVCRGTIREALRRLAARGLVVQRPGRKTRAVALDESLTLENLGLALHDARSPQARWLLEGYFSLKRQVLVELLVDCCARASDRDLNRLGSACFRLQDAARWESGATCAQAEFELLREAARVAERPGHVLLVQSLQRAFMGGAAPLLPLLGGAALRAWASRAMAILHERDVRALQHELPALMKACDELVLNAFAPTVPEPQEQDSSETPSAQGGPLSATVPASLLDDSLEAGAWAEERSLGPMEPAVAETVVLGVAPCPRDEAADLGSGNGTLLTSSVARDVVGGHNGVGGDMRDDASVSVSDGCADAGASSGEECIHPAVPPSGSFRHSLGAEWEAGGLLRGTLGRLGRWWVLLLRWSSDAFAGAMLPRRMGQRSSG